MSGIIDEDEDAGAIMIEGGRLLRGKVQVSGSKNAALPIIAAAILAEGTSVLRGVPDIVDVRLMIEMMRDLGVESHWENDTLFLKNSQASEPAYQHQVSGDSARRMRASLLLLGPALARLGRIVVPLPGGCTIGPRPIDQHMDGLRQLGARVMIKNEEIKAMCRKGSLHGYYTFTVQTVTGTANLMLAASLNENAAHLHNVAKEPEIEELAVLLQGMGVRIDGAGTSSITVQGTSQPKPYCHDLMPDRVECGTFMIAGALLGDPLIIEGIVAEQHTALIAILRSIGASVFIEGQTASISSPMRGSAAIIRTSTYPGVPTDLQPQLMSLLAFSEGTSVITESIFETGFKHVSQLQQMGADIAIDGNRATITGVPLLHGSSITATDLRAGAGLLIAALKAEGRSFLRGLKHLDRGYQEIERKLSSVGARTCRVSTNGSTREATGN